MPKKKIKDLTLEELKAICRKARTNKKGKEKEWCVNDCPLYFWNMKMCEIVSRLNQEIEVEDEQ